MTDTKYPEVEVLEPAKAGKRRRFSTDQKMSLLREAEEPGQSISSVARRYGISPSLMFRWKKMMDEGALAGLAADEAVVAERQVKELQTKVRELERLLGKKTMEVEILQEAVGFARGKGWLLQSSSPPKRGSR